MVRMDSQHLTLAPNIGRPGRVYGEAGFFWVSGAVG